MNTTYALPNARRQPVTFVSGEGCYLVDDVGKRYLDLVSGLGVNALGHNHPRVTRAIQEQAGRLLHTSALYGNEYQEALASELCRLSGTQRAVFVNSGTEATEAALRMVRFYSPRTRVIEVTHITNLTGQIMPVREIMRLAKPRGIEVFVDGAHAFGQWPMKRDEMEVDFYGTSLHKWLHAPIGAGFLYVRREKIPKLWPMMAAAESQTADIRKYEEIGTHPQANFNAVSAALAFSQGMGLDRKISRLRYLRDRWAKRLLAESDRVRVLTPLGPDKSGAICLFNVEGIDPVKLGGWLLDRHRIVNTPIVHPEFHGIRITPSVYTSVTEIDTFADAVLQAIKFGIAS